MPIHPAIASNFHFLEGIESFEAALADPVLRERLDAFMSITGAPAPPPVETRDDAAPGPHGQVPVRVYLPDDGGERPCLVWMHDGAFMGGDLDMPEADWTARQVCERAGAVVVRRRLPARQRRRALPRSARRRRGRDPLGPRLRR